MRGTVAKKLRKIVYGDLSLYTPRKYERQGRKYDKKRKTMVSTRTLTLPKGSPRQRYQAAKKLYMEGRVKL